MALNLSTNPQYRYILGLKHQGMIEELLCTDDVAYGGDGLTQNPPQTVSPYPHKDFPCSVTVQLAPLSAHIFLLKEKPDEAGTKEGKTDSDGE